MLKFQKRSKIEKNEFKLTSTPPNPENTQKIQNDGQL
jgi:hypothetical protein